MTIYQRDSNKDFNIKYLLSELDEKVQVSGLHKLSQVRELNNYNVNANTTMLSALLIEIEKLEANRLGQEFLYDVNSAQSLLNQNSNKIFYKRDLNKDYILTIIISELDDTQEAKTKINFSDIKKLSEFHDFDIINSLIQILLNELDIAEAKKLGQEYYPNNHLKEKE